MQRKIVMISDVDLLKTIVESIVTKPNGVKIDRKVDDAGVLLELTVDPSDMGTVIGKKGSMAGAFRTIFYAYANRHTPETKISIKVIEPEGSTFGAAALPDQPFSMQM